MSQDSGVPPDLPPEDLKFGELAVAQGLCTAEQVAECVELLRQLARKGTRPLPRLGGLLLQRGYLGQAESGRTLMIQDKPSSSVREAAGPEAPRAAEADTPPEAEAALSDSRNIVGKYVRVRLLGVGGMGEVWKAWDRELKRWVALKFLKHDDAREQARFRIEAQAAAALNHPNICAIYEVGRHEGRPYIAMQYLEGMTLGAHPRGDRPALVRIFQRVALAIQRAHEAGVIHRDLKPANIMVDARGDVFVMDFGLAKATHVDSSVSVSGSVVGTPAYMSPEQAKGRSDVDGRADVYSLGATMYEIFGGEPVFSGSGVYDILVRIQEEEPRPLRRRNPQFDRELDTIVLKCLEKDPGRRYSGAAELAEDLRRWLDREPILAHSPSALYRLSKTLLKRKTVVRLSAVVVLAVAALGAVSWRWMTSSTAEKAAEEEADSQRRRREESERRLAAARPHLDRGQRSLSQIDLKMRDRDFSPLALVVEAEDHFQKALAACEELPEAHLGMAKVSALAGNRAQRLRHIDRAIALDPKFATAYLDRVRVLFQDYEEERHDPSGTPRPESERARELRVRIEADLRQYELCVREKTPEGDYARGMMAFCAGGYERAASLLAEYLVSVPADGEAHYWRGHALVHLERFDEAEKSLTQALSCNARDLAALKYRASARMRLKNLEGAVADLTEVIALDRESAYAHLERGTARLALGQLAPAQQDIDASLALKESWQGRLQKGVLYLARNDPDSALSQLDAALLLSESGRSAALLLREMARAKLMKGDRAGARANLEMALRKAPDDYAARAERGALREAAGDRAGAADDYREALRLAPPHWPDRPALEKRLAALGL
jgi:serine/threonine-protein kinase